MPTKKKQTQQAKEYPNWIFIAVLIVLPLLFFSPVFDAGFINLDDGRFIANNKIIKEGTLANIPKAFTEQYNSPHYKPLVYYELDDRILNFWDGSVHFSF